MCCHIALNHVLMPVGGAIYVNALTGNLPACFMELRLALESLVKCYLADLKYSDRPFFQEKLNLLETGIKIDQVLHTEQATGDLRWFRAGLHLQTRAEVRAAFVPPGRHKQTKAALL